MKKFLIGMAVVALTAVASEAAIHYVSKGGSNADTGADTSHTWLTIQYAITNAATAAGDEIRVGEGTYAESVAVTRNSMILRGGYNASTWTWDPTNHPTIVKPANNTLDCIAFQGFGETIDGFSLISGHFGVNCGYGNQAIQTVLHCVITNNAQQGINVNATGSKTDLKAVNCLIARNGSDGISFNVDNGAGSSLILNCTIADNVGYGCVDYNGNQLPTAFTNCIIANNLGGIKKIASVNNIEYVGSCCVYGNTNGNFIYPVALGPQGFRLQGGNFAGYPKFVGNGDYHLQSGSPCVGFGADLTGSGVTDDLAGNVRSAPFDVGCYQSGLSAASRYADAYVNASQPDDTGDGSTSGTAKKTIGAGLAFTAAGGVCHVASGTYVEDVFMDVPNLRVQGADWNTTIVTSKVPHIVMLTGTNDIFAGFTLQGATFGAAMWGTPTSTDNNRVEGCVIRGNTYGVYGVQDGVHRRFQVYGCIISNNTYGVYAAGSKPAVDVRNCLIVRNTSHGVYVDVDNCNYAQYVINCTIADNGGSGYLDINNSVRTAYITNCIVAGNAWEGIKHTGAAYQHYLGCNCAYGNGTNNYWYANNDPTRLTMQGGNISGYPKFVGGGDYHLQAGSPCVGCGATVGGVGLTNDLDGNPRGAPFDMGCYQSAFAGTRYAATYVDANQSDDTLDGSTPGTAKKTIGAGLALTAPAGVCHVAAGTYNEALLCDVPNVRVEGTNASAIVASLAPHAVWVTGTNVAIAGLALKNRTFGALMQGPQAVNNLLEACAIYGNTYGVYGVPQDGINRRFQVYRCVVTNNTYGLYSSGGKSAVDIRNSLIARNTTDGVYWNVDNSAYVNYVFNCTIVNNTQSGYRDEHGSENTTYFTNNIVTGNGLYGVRHAGTAYSSYIAYCDVFNNLTNLNGSSLIVGAGMLAVDPVFQGANDFHLQNGSLCVGAGVSLAGVGLTNDLEGTFRSNAYDLGCYESPYVPIVKSTSTYVDATRPDDSGAGTNWVTAKKTIGAGLAVTLDNGICNVAGGTYAGGITLPANITVQGTNCNNVIVTDPTTVFTVSQTNNVLRNLTVMGSVNGVYVSAQSSDIVLDRCVLRGNTYGVTVPNTGTRTITLSHCIVTNNTSHGVYFFSGRSSVYARNCLFAGNGGDGILIDGVDNGPTSLVYNCTFANNTGSGYRDTHPSSASVVLKNCIASGNGVYGICHLGYANMNYLLNSCVYGNGINVNAPANMILINDTIIGALPRFAGTADFHLLAGSPCVDRGLNLTGEGITDDLDGTARTAPFDMGCYQSANTLAPFYAQTYADQASADDTAVGTNWSTARKTIGSALAATALGGVCSVAAGTYAEPIFMPANVTLVGAGRDMTIITGVWNIVSLPATNVTVRGVTLRGGVNGVNVTTNGTAFLVDQCSILGNTYGVYEGLYGGQRGITLNQCIVVSNTSHGVYAQTTAALAATNCLFACNGGDGVRIESDNCLYQSYLVYCTMASNVGSGYVDINYTHRTTALTNCISSGNGAFGVRHVGAAYNDYIGYCLVNGNATNLWADNGTNYLVVGAGMITNQPCLFIGGSFTQTEFSPGLDAALDVGVTNDVLGLRRPKFVRHPFSGTGLDMGAYEMYPPPPGTVFDVR